MRILYHMFLSPTSRKVRIALREKNLEFELRSEKVWERRPEFLAINPAGQVPVLIEENGATLCDSVAITEYLDETHPEPFALLPADPLERAHVRAMAALIGCDVHPLNNLRVGKALRETFGADQAAVDAWAARWIIPGFEAMEALVARHGTGWCFGDAPTLADCYLIPQIYSARRFNVPLDAFPRLLAIDAAAALHPAFIAAHPDNQPDAD